MTSMDSDQTGQPWRGQLSRRLAAQSCGTCTRPTQHNLRYSTIRLLGSIVCISLTISISVLLEPFHLCPWCTCPEGRTCCGDVGNGSSGCMENVHETCGACCCCCCMFADNQMRAGLLAGADSSNLADVRDAYCKQFCLRAVLCCPLCRCGYYARARNAFRHKVGGGQPLEGSGCSLTWLCGCCTLIQEKRELDLRGMPLTQWRLCGIPLPPNSDHKYCCCSFSTIDININLKTGSRAASPSQALPPPTLRLQNRNGSAPATESVVPAPKREEMKDGDKFDKI